MNYGRVSPGYITTGVIDRIVDVYNNKVRVRILEFHGIGSDTGNGSTPTPSDDANPLPIASVELPTGRKIEDTYHVGDLVRVTFPSGDIGYPLVTGVIRPATQLGRETVNVLLGRTSTASSTGSSGGKFISASAGPSVTVTNNIEEFKDIFQSPVSNCRVTSSYGPRYLGKDYDFHLGIDLGGFGEREPVHAAADGVVVFIKSNHTVPSPTTTSPFAYSGNESYGNMIYLSHEIKGKTYYTRYAHLSHQGPAVKGLTAGSKVSKGDHIGFAGNTGNSSGVHLHFEIIVDGETQNPANYISF